MCPTFLQWTMPHPRVVGCMTLRVAVLLLSSQNNTVTMKKICSYGNSPLSSPFQPDLNTRWQTTLNISIYLSDDAENGTPKVARKTFNVGKFCKPKCFYGDRNIKLLTRSIFCKLLLQTIRFPIQIGWDFFFIRFDQNLVELMTSPLG